ncbi:MAG: putative zinc-binding metallopeptidase [Solirubrobacteraceae bacterium]|nr:putative zinc-binding metallopeptidase [Solirubrobacteraceae bacterium]
MRAAQCETCGQLVFFENSLCLNCKSPLGFDVPTLELVTLTGDRASAVRCGNLQVARCNWLVEKEGEEFCLSCRMTTVRPSDDDEEGLERYATAEVAKRRVIRQLLTLGFPVDENLLDFKLKNSSVEPVMTGHADGTVTLDLAESDDARRVALREQLGEPYRTLVGHFRHELGHYYQDILLNTEQKWEHSRAMFGDERDSYQDALDRHYENGPPKDWPSRFVSAYATMHPWEDWAETFAHYLHIRAVLETAADFGVSVEGPEAVNPDGDRDEFESAPQLGASDRSFDEILSNWLPLTYALNQINRAMGKEDLYPFALSQPAIDKLTFMHLLVRAQKNERELEETAASQSQSQS